MACDKNNIKTVYSPMINHNGYYEIDFEDVRQKWKQKILNYVFLLIRIIQQVVWSEDELKQLGQIMVDNDVHHLR